jgi:hypothetical protein
LIEKHSGIVVARILLVQKTSAVTRGNLLSYFGQIDRSR